MAAHPSARPAPDVSVVIVTYNGTPWLRRCLDSLAPATTGPVVEVVDALFESTARYWT